MEKQTFIQCNINKTVLCLATNMIMNNFCNKVKLLGKTLNDEISQCEGSATSMYSMFSFFKQSCSLFMQDRIYWTDLEDEAIYSANRLTGHDVAKVAEHLNNPLDLVVFHEQRQPKGKT